MGNILFQNSQPKQKTDNSILNMLSSMKLAGSSNAVFNQMYNTNPQFRQFADSMRSKSPEQAFMENGLNFNDFRKFKW